MPILELLADVEDVDPNLADNDGNTPLIFAAQAGKHAAHNNNVNLRSDLGRFNSCTICDFNVLTSKGKMVKAE